LSFENEIKMFSFQCWLCCSYSLARHYLAM
jgi:hypothetical protein